MANTSISKRVIFPKRKQKEFLEVILERMTIQQAAKLCRISERTVRDWRREKFSMDAQALSLLCKKIKISIPKGIKLEDRYWYTLKGAKRGWEVVKKKYGKVPGNEEYRKKRWFEWWEREGKHQKGWIKISHPLSIKQPRFSEKLAEFVGIILGDGGITDYQVTVTLNSRTERGYASFIESLISRLFNVPVARYYRDYQGHESSINLVISRIELVRFCINKLGLLKGNKTKHQVDIPLWIKSSRNSLLACIRGLMDTDGTVFRHRYKVNGKWYSYKKLSFTSHSAPLRESVFLGLKSLGFNPRKSGSFDVRLERVSEVQNYFSTVGVHNPEHLKNYVK